MMNHFPERPDNSDPPCSSTQLTFPPKATAISCPRERLQRGQQARLTQCTQRGLCTVTHPLVREALGSRQKAPTPGPTEIYTGDTEGQPHSCTYPMHKAEKGCGNTLICPLCFKFQVISCRASRLQFSGCVLLRLPGTVRGGRSQC